jgi:hypothetical protein
MSAPLGRSKSDAALLQHELVKRRVRGLWELLEADISSQPEENASRAQEAFVLLHMRLTKVLVPGTSSSSSSSPSSSPPVQDQQESMRARELWTEYKHASEARVPVTSLSDYVYDAVVHAKLSAHAAGKGFIRTDDQSLFRSGTAYAELLERVMEAVKETESESGRSFVPLVDVCPVDMDELLKLTTFAPQVLECEEEEKEKQPESEPEAVEEKEEQPEAVAVAETEDVAVKEVKESTSTTTTTKKGGKFQWSPAIATHKLTKQGEDESLLGDSNMMGMMKAMQKQALVPPPPPPSSHEEELTEQDKAELLANKKTMGMMKGFVRRKKLKAAASDPKERAEGEAKVASINQTAVAHEKPSSFFTPTTMLLGDQLFVKGLDAPTAWSSDTPPKSANSFVVPSAPLETAPSLATATDSEEMSSPFGLKNYVHAAAHPTRTHRDEVADAWDALQRRDTWTSKMKRLKPELLNKDFFDPTQTVTAAKVRKKNQAAAIARLPGQEELLALMQEAAERVELTAKKAAPPSEFITVASGAPIHLRVRPRPANQMTDLHQSPDFVARNIKETRSHRPLTAAKESSLHPELYKSYFQYDHEVASAQGRAFIPARDDADDVIRAMRAEKISKLSDALGICMPHKLAAPAKGGGGQENGTMWGAANPNTCPLLPSFPVVETNVWQTGRNRNQTGSAQYFKRKANVYEKPPRSKKIVSGMDHRSVSRVDMASPNARFAKFMMHKAKMKKLPKPEDSRGLRREKSRKKIDALDALDTLGSMTADGLLLSPQSFQRLQLRGEELVSPNHLARSIVKEDDIDASIKELTYVVNTLVPAPVGVQPSPDRAALNFTSEPGKRSESIEQSQAARVVADNARTSIWSHDNQLALTARESDLREQYLPFYPGCSRPVAVPLDMCPVTGPSEARVRVSKRMMVVKGSFGSLRTGGPAPELKGYLREQDDKEHEVQQQEKQRLLESSAADATETEGGSDAVVAEELEMTVEHPLGLQQWGKGETLEEEIIEEEEEESGMESSAFNSTHTSAASSARDTLSMHADPPDARLETIDSPVDAPVEPLHRFAQQFYVTDLASYTPESLSMQPSGSSKRNAPKLVPHDAVPFTGRKNKNSPDSSERSSSPSSSSFGGKFKGVRRPAAMRNSTSLRGLVTKQPNFEEVNNMGRKAQHSRSLSDFSTHSRSNGGGSRIMSPYNLNGIARSSSPLTTDRGSKYASHSLKLAHKASELNARQPVVLKHPVSHIYVPPVQVEWKSIPRKQLVLMPNMM